MRVSCIGLSLGLALLMPACSVQRLDLRHVDWAISNDEFGGEITASVPHVDALVDSHPFFAPPGSSGWFASGLLEWDPGSDVMKVRFPVPRHHDHGFVPLMDADRMVLAFRKAAGWFIWDVAIADVDLHAVKAAVRRLAEERARGTETAGS